MDIIERIKFKLTGQGVPVVRLSNIGADGEVGTIQFISKVKKRPNSLVEAWDQIGWQIDKGPTEIIDEKGVSRIGYIVDEAGRTVRLTRWGTVVANWEGVIGKFAMADDISENLDLGKSAKQLAIGLVIGLVVGALILGPILQGMLS